jgi:hypothetical protein
VPDADLERDEFVHAAFGCLGAHVGRVKNYLRALPWLEVARADQAVKPAHGTGCSAGESDLLPVSAHAGDLARPAGKRADLAAGVGQDDVAGKLAGA